jgi:hypothetical protein
MRTWRFSQSVLLGGILLSLACPVSADLVFVLIPSNGTVSGLPGFLVGWGYSLTNTDPSNWFLSTAMNSDSFSNGTPTLLFDFPILAPGAMLSEPFDPSKSIGIFELQWDPSAPVGFVNSGNFVLRGQSWDGDPLTGGNFIADAPDISLSYAATVSSSASSVPEPSTFVLLAIGICVLSGYRLVKNRSTSRTWLSECSINDCIRTSRIQGVIWVSGFLPFARAPLIPSRKLAFSCRARGERTGAFDGRLSTKRALSRELFSEALDPC